MYHKIIKRSLYNMRDSYLIYILACAFAIGVFGILISLGDNPSVRVSLRSWNSFISDITVIMSGIFAFCAFIYMAYVGGFFIKQQRNEFRTFEKLGMQRWVIVAISFIQTTIVQAFAWIIGLTTTLIFQKFMGMALFYLMRLRFNFIMHISWNDVFLLTKIFFFSTLALSVVNAIKTFLILHRKTVKREIKTRWWLRIPAGLFGLLLLFSAQICTVSLFYDMHTISYSSKPGVEIFFVMLADIFGTYLVYFGFLPTILNTLQRIHSVSYSGINMFSFKYLKERLFQNISILWFVTELSALALMLLTFCYFGYQAVHRNYNSIYPFELAADKSTVGVIKQELKNSKAHIKGEYQTNVKVNLVSYYKKDNQDYIRQPMTFMSYSDYMSLPKRMRKWNSKINSREFLKIDYNGSIFENRHFKEHDIQVKNSPVIATVKTGSSFPYGSSMHFGPMMVVPDKYYQKMPAEVEDTFYGWDFKRGDRLSTKQLEKLDNFRDAYYMKVDFKKTLDQSTIEVLKKAPDRGESIYTQAGFLRQGSIKKNFTQAGGFYLFIVSLFSIALLIALGSVLTLRILLRDDYQSRQLRTLQKIGVEESEVKRIVRRENTLTFLIPLIFALAQSIVTIAMSNTGRHISKNIILIYAGYVVLYGLFGLVSFKVSWHGIKHKFSL